MGFVRQVRGELRKLVNPITVGLLLVLIAFFWQDLSRTNSLAAVQPDIAVAGHMSGQEDLAAKCAPGAPYSAQECRLAQENERLNRLFASNSVELGRIGRSFGTLPGLATFVAHQLTTGMGWLFVALLAAMHITREESRGTVGASILRAGRSRYLGAKAVSLVVVAMVALVASTLVLFAIRSTFAVHPTVPTGMRNTDTGQIPTGNRALAPDATWSSWGHAGAAVWHALVVLVVVAAVFTVLASRFRRPLPAATAGGGVIALFLGLAEWLHRSSWGPMGGLSRLLGLDHVPFGVMDVRLWDVSTRPPDLNSGPFGTVAASAFQVGSQRAPDPYTALVAWLVIAIVVVVSGWWAITKRNFAS